LNIKIERLNNGVNFLKLNTLASFLTKKKAEDRMTEELDEWRF